MTIGNIENIHNVYVAKMQQKDVSNSVSLNEKPLEKGTQSKKKGCC